MNTLRLPAHHECQDHPRTTRTVEDGLAAEMSQESRNLIRHMNVAHIQDRTSAATRLRTKLLNLAADAVHALPQDPNPDSLRLMLCVLTMDPRLDTHIIRLDNKGHCIAEWPIGPSEGEYPHRYYTNLFSTTGVVHWTITHTSGPQAGIPLSGVPLAPLRAAQKILQETRGRRLYSDKPFLNTQQMLADTLTLATKVLAKTIEAETHWTQVPDEPHTYAAHTGILVFTVSHRFQPDPTPSNTYKFTASNRNGLIIAQAQVHPPFHQGTEVIRSLFQQADLLSRPSPRPATAPTNDDRSSRKRQ